jgi:hypothetical protein
MLLLKGLSILLNTCNKQTVKKYSNFYDFIQLESNRLIESILQGDRSNLANANNLDISFDDESSLNAIVDNFELKETILSAR